MRFKMENDVLGFLWCPPGVYVYLDAFDTILILVEPSSFCSFLDFVGVNAGYFRSIPLFILLADWTSLLYDLFDDSLFRPAFV